MEELLRDVSVPAPKAKSTLTQKAKARNLTREAIKQELVQHLLSARDFALTTQNQTGVPQLLPRPTLAEIGQRLEFSEATASRYINSKDDWVLRELWDIAVDVYRILSFRPPS